MNEIMIIIQKLEIFFSRFFYEYTSIYLYSALLQANAAILAIVGVFGIFKIQSIQTKIDFLKNGLTSPPNTGWHPDDMDNFEKKSPEEQKIQISTIHESPINIILTSIWKYNDLTSNIKPIIVSSTKLLGFGILIDALCLIFSKIIHNSSSILEFCLVMFIFIFHIFIIIHTVKSINKLIGTAR